MAIKKYLGKKALKFGKKLFGKKARSAAQKRALAKAVKISAMRRSKNKVAKTTIGFFKPKKVVTKTSFKVAKAVKYKGGKKVSKAAAAKLAQKQLAKQSIDNIDTAMSFGDKARLTLAGTYLAGAGAFYVGNKIENARFRKRLRAYKNEVITERNARIDKRRNRTAPPQLSPELELNAQKQKIQNETEKYLREMRRKLEQEKRNAKNSIIQNRKTGTI